MYILFSSLEGLDDVNSASGMAQALTGYNGTGDTFSLINQDAQLVASVTGAFAFLNPINIETETFAGATTIMKMSLDLQEGRSIDPNDVLSLVGNIAGAVATVAFYAAAPEVGAAAAALGVSATLSEVAAPYLTQALANAAATLPTVNVTATPPPTIGYATMSNTVMTLPEIQASGAQVAGWNVTPNGAQLVPVSDATAAKLGLPPNINNRPIIAGGGDPFGNNTMSTQ